MIAALPPAVQLELRDRYMAEAMATERRASYLRGVLDTIGIDPARYAGFNDVTGEILVTPEPEALIEQPDPGQGSPEPSPDPASGSAAASSPPGGGSPAITQPEQVTDGEDIADGPHRPAPASQPGSAPPGESPRARTPGSRSGAVGKPTPVSPSGSAVEESRRMPTRALSEPSFELPAPALTVACPQCGTLVKPQGLGSHQRKHKDGYTPPPGPIPAGTMATCPECGKEVKAMGLGTHRRQSHGRGRKTILVKPPPEHKPAKPRAPRIPHGRDGQAQCPTCKDWFVSDAKLEVHRARSHGYQAGNGRSETFLCDRCPRSFTTREQLSEHRSTHAEPPRGAPVGRDPMARRQDASASPLA